MLINPIEITKDELDYVSRVLLIHANGSLWLNDEEKSIIRKIADKFKQYE